MRYVYLRISPVSKYREMMIILNYSNTTKITRDIYTYSVNVNAYAH